MSAKRKQSSGQTSQRMLGRLFFIWGLVLGTAACAVAFLGAPAFSEWRGAVCEREQQLIPALQWMRWAGSLGSNSSEYWFARSRIARKLALNEERVECLTRARDRGAPRKSLELEVILADAQRGQLNRLRQQLSELLNAGGPGDEIGNAYAEGCLISYQLDEALSMLAVWQADYPNDGRPHFLRGRILEHRTNLPGAEEEFKKALEKQPKFAAAAYNIGQTLVNEQKPEAAMPYFRICKSYLGTPVPGLVAEAYCLRLLRRYEDAKECLSTAERADSGLALLGFRLVGEPFESAHSKLIAEQGRLAAEMGDHLGAVTYLERALAAAPLDWRIRYQLALSQRQVGEVERARENLQIVEETKEALATCDRLFDDLRKDPGNVPARLHIGKIFLKYLSENQGLVWLNSVLDLDEHNGDAHRLLAEYFESQASTHPELVEPALKHRKRASKPIPQPVPNDRKE